MDLSSLGSGVGLALIAVALLAAWLGGMLAAERRRRAQLDLELAEAGRRAAKDRERASIAERELEAERVRMAPIAEGHQHLLTSLSRGFQDIGAAKDAATVMRLAAETAERAFDPSQVLVFSADGAATRDYVLCGVGGHRGSPWGFGARINDTMGRIGLVLRRRLAMDRTQFDAEPPIVRDQLDRTEPSGFVVEVAVPLVVGGSVTAVVSVGGSTLTLEATRAGLELLAAHAASQLRALESQARLERLRNTDDLTGLGSKGWFVAEGSETIFRSRNENAPAALVMLAVDDFKGYVARTGHGAGDKLLRGVAQTLSKFCGAKLLAARWSGAEFIVLAPRTTPREALVIAERLRAAVAAAEWPNGANQPRGRLTMSAGVSFLSSSAKNLDQMIEVAAESLASARADGDATHSAPSNEIGVLELVTQEFVTEPPGSGPGPRQ